MKPTVLPAPTGQQCDSHAVVWEDETRIGHAIWYPQMGGYRAKAVAVFFKQWWEDDRGVSAGGCVDVYVWHDGDWPFDDGDDEYPRRIHHCDPKQFVTFGEALVAINDAHRVPAPTT